MENNNIPDANQSWNAAEKLIDNHFRRKKLRKILLFISVPTLILLGLFFIPVKKNTDYNQKFSNEALPNSGSIKGTDQVDEVKPNSPFISNSVTNNSLTPDKNSTDQVAQKNKSNLNKQTASPAVIANQSSAKETTIQSSSNTSKNGNLTNKVESISHQSESNQTTATIYNEGKVKVENTRAFSASRKNKNQTVSTVAVNSEKSVKHKSEMDIVVTPKSHLEVNSTESKTSYSQPADKKRESDLMLTSSITFLNTFDASLPVKSKLADTEEKSWPRVVKNSRKCHVAWEASLTGGVHFMNKSLDGNNEWQNYFMHRKNEEDAIVVPSIGVAVSATCKSLSISMGVEYAAYGEKTNYYPFSIQPTIIETSGWNTFITNYVDIDTAYVTGNQLLLQSIRQVQDSNFVVVRDTIEEYKYDEAIAKNNSVNHSYYLELPIELSYCLNRGRTGFGISGGVAPAMLANQSGHYLRTDGKGIESFSEIKTFRKYLFNARLSADFYFRFSAKAKLVLRPQIRSNLNSVFDNDYGVKQKYFSTGVLFGVSYMLN